MTIEVMRSDMVAAMKAKDKVRKEAISALISAAKKVFLISSHALSGFDKEADTNS